ncbi:MAG: phosphatase PAP2 family protein [Verrucomicrobiota bacterium]|jgi:membrane-associated phospholipid phosphatase
MTAPRKWPWVALFWLLAGAAGIALAWPLDGTVDTALAVNRNGRLHELAWWCSKLGEGWAPAVAGLCAAFLLVRMNRPVPAARIFFVVLACEFTGLAGLVLRILIGRTRPLADVPPGFYGVWYHGHWIIGKYEFSAFPSGHAATAAGLAVAAWLVHRGWGAVAAAYALAVMWSRIALQCHHLSDVVASVALAVPLAVLFKKILLPSLEFQFVNWRRSRPEGV